MQEGLASSLLTPWLTMGAVAAYYFGHFVQGKEKMSTSSNERIVLELERAGLTLGVDAEGDVTLDHAITAIRSLGDKLREDQAAMRSLRRVHARTDHQRARAVIKAADLEAQLRACQESYEARLSDVEKRLEAANNVLARREEAAQDFLKSQQAKHDRKKKKGAKR